MSDRQVLKNLLDDFFHEVLDRLEERKTDLLRWIAIGRRVEEDCMLYGNSAWMRRDDGVIERVDMAKLKMVVLPDDEPTRLDYGPQFGEEEPYRELTDAEERAEEATWD